MTKVAVVSDTHFGARNDSPVLQASMAKFFDTIFFPTLDQHQITTVIHPGDYWDRRKYVNFATAQFVNEHYRRPMTEREITEYIIPGNHDCFYKHSTTINGIAELYRLNPRMHIIDEPREVSLGVHRILFLPWICDDNYQRSVDLITTSTAPLVIGHLQLAGFQMYRGQPAEDGMDPALFERFDLVLSGHYHHKSTKGPIHYVGAPYPMIWSDYKDPRGFHLLDLDTHELTFIENPYCIFHRMVYDDAGQPFEYIERLKADIEAADSPFRSAYIKIVVKSKHQPYWFEMLMDSLYKVNALDVIITDDIIVNEDDTETPTSEDLTTVDTLSVITEFVDTLSINCDKGELTKYLRALYHEASEAQQ